MSAMHFHAWPGFEIGGKGSVSQLVIASVQESTRLNTNSRYAQVTVISCSAMGGSCKTSFVFRL